MLTVITAASTSDLTLLETVKQELSITGTSDDSYLERLISEVSEVLTEACNRTTFGREEVRQTERLSCAVDSIFLERDINPDISAVAVDGTTLDTDEYELDGFRLFHLSDDRRICWPGGSKVEVTYEAGFDLSDTRPRSIERACISLVVSTYRARGRDSNIARLQTEGVGSVSFFDAVNWRNGLPPDIQASVDHWRRVNV